MLTFLAGMMTGGAVGVLVMCLCAVAGNADRQMDDRQNK